jgi:hypothetical protein|tara:strand:+ start:70 stop:312 length:243 start_codon:yes stop_codon:yes gene_type:complete
MRHTTYGDIPQREGSKEVYFGFMEILHPPKNKSFYIEHASGRSPSLWLIEDMKEFKKYWLDFYPTSGNKPFLSKVEVCRS